MNKKYFLSIAFILLVLSISNSILGYTVIITDKSIKTNISKNISYYQEKDKSASINDLISKKIIMKKIKKDYLFFGYKRIPLWLSFSIQNKSKHPYYFVIPIPTIDSIEVFILDKDKVIEKYTMGDNYHYNNRKIRNRYYCIPITGKSSFNYYIKIQSSSRKMFYPYVYSIEAFHDYDKYELAIIWSFVGLMTILALYNLLIFFSIKDKVYIFYVIICALYAIHQLALQGILSAQFMVFNEQLTKNIPNLLSTFFFFSTIQFSRYFLKIKKYSILLDKIFSFTSLLAIPLLFIFIIFKVSLVINIFIYTTSFFVFPFIIYIAIKQLKITRDKSIIFYLLSWNFAFIAVIFIVLNNLNIYVLKNVGIEGIIPFTTLHVVFLSLGLGNRINNMQKELEELNKSISIHNIDLEKTILERTRLISKKNEELEYQLSLAREYQSSLLPVSMPDIPGVKLAFRYEPYYKVSGDFIDFYYNEGPELGLFICDVSGHGVASAFMSSMVKISLNIWPQYIHFPDKFLKAIASFIQDKLNNNFVSAFSCTINIETGEIDSSNCGHPLSIIIRKDGSIQYIASRGHVIAEYYSLNNTISKDTLQSGDKLVLYTDGVIECMNQNNELFGEENFSNFLKQVNHLEPDEMCDKVINYLTEFAGSKENIEDDIAILITEIL